MDNQIQKNPAPNGASENQIDFTGLNAPEPMGGKSTFQKPVSSQKSQTVTATMPTQAPVSQPQASTSVPPNTPPPPSPPAPNQTYDPLEDGHKSPVASYVLMAVLTLILILGVLVFISWKGWISLGGVEKLWGGGRVTSTPTVSPTESSTISPSISSSPVSPGPTSSTVVGNVNDQIRKSDLVRIKNALTEYNQVYSKYPLSPAGTKTSDTGSELARALIPVYLSDLPVDPKSPDNYYFYKSDGSNYEITCVLEDKTDPSGTQVGQYYIYKVTNLTK